MTADKVEGEQGFKDDKKKELPKDIMSKEESMFKIDNNGAVMPEKYPIHLYDFSLDDELLSESMILMTCIKKKKSQDSVIVEMTAKANEELKKLKETAEKEPDKKVKERLLMEVKNTESAQVIEDFKTKINNKIVEEGITESRELLNELKAEKERQKVTKYVELIPCTVSESYSSFEKGKTIEGKETPDWLSDLISKKVINPPFTFPEATNLRPDYKLALKHALMAVSNYRVTDYREVMMAKKVSEESPLKVKKE